MFEPSEYELSTHIESMRVRFSSALEASLSQTADVTAPAVAPILRDRLGRTLDHFLDPFARADLVSQHFQTRYSRASRLVFLLAAFAVMTAAAQFIFHLPQWTLYGEVGAISLVLIIIHHGNRKGWHRNWVDHRLLAERLRCGVFLAFLAGRASGEIGEHWSCRWVSRTWSVKEYERIWNARPRFEHHAEEALGVLKVFTADTWLDVQRRFNDNKQVVERRRHARVSAASEIFFWLTFVSALVHLAPHAWYEAAHIDHEHAGRVLAFLVIALPALGAAFSGLRSHFGYKKLADRCVVMIDHLDALKKHVVATDSIDSFCVVVWDIESLMLQETADWHVDIGFRVIEAQG